MIKSGDIVEIIVLNPEGSFIQKGDVGEVTFVEEDANGIWAAVDFDFDFEGAHDCDGHCDNGWWISVENIRKK